MLTGHAGEGPWALSVQHQRCCIRRAAKLCIQSHPRGPWAGSRGSAGRVRGCAAASTSRDHLRGKPVKPEAPAKGPSVVLGSQDEGRLQLRGAEGWVWPSQSGTPLPRLRKALFIEAQEKLAKPVSALPTPSCVLVSGEQASSSLASVADSLPVLRPESSLLSL